MRVVIGLDLGTTYSGFSFMRVNPARRSFMDTNLSSDMFTVWEWPDRGSFPQYPKTPTALFYQPDGTFLYWGWRAKMAALKKEPGFLVEVWCACNVLLCYLSTSFPCS